MRLTMCLIFVLLSAACGIKKEQPTVAPVSTSTNVRPSLLLIIVVDQFSPLHLKQFAPHLSSGTAKLLREGTVYTNAAYRHAVTETCPGHATLATGEHPRVHGITGNEWIDTITGKEVYCVGDEEFGRSPRNLRAVTLGDDLKARFPASRVYSVSGKDRSAIILGGRSPHGAFWFDKKAGSFVTSSYYTAPSPQLRTVLYDATPSASLFGRVWDLHTKTRDALTHGGVKTIDGDRGAFGPQFPRAFGGLQSQPDERYFEGIYRSPFLDEVTGSAARAILTHERLGVHAESSSSPAVDALFVSFSALDTVGHEWGPTSKEAFDTLIRVDDEIGRLIEAAEAQVGADKLLIVLTSDHGVLPLPEASSPPADEPSIPGARLQPATVQCVHQAAVTFSKEYGEGVLGQDFVISDAAARARHGANALPRLRQALAGLIRGCPQVRAVWTRDELGNGGIHSSNADTHHLASYRQAFELSQFPARSSDISVLWDEGVLPYVTTFDTGHGTPYRYDAHVPLIIRRPGQRVGGEEKASVGMEEVKRFVLDGL